jgi:hypothetical protein
MPLDISFQTMRVLINGHGSEGVLSSWTTNFDMYNVPHPMLLFKTPEEAGTWVKRTLML